MLKDRIKELREKNNLNIAAFARSLGISPTSASLYESGKQNPGKKTIAKICEVYGVDEAWLLDTASKTVGDTPTTPVADKGVKKTGRKAEKTDAAAMEEKKIDKTAILARVAEIGVRKAAEEAGVAWQTVNKWKKDALADDFKEVMKDLPTVEDIKESMGELTTPADLKAGLEAIATVVEMIEEPTVKKEKKTTKKVMKAVNLIIQSPMGGAITPEQILAKIPSDADSVYVRVDENKLYYVLKNGETGNTDIWE